MSNPRNADHPIEPIFLNRWSPRSYDASEMPEADLLRILEAARWAQSCYNIQPWRFLYARRGDAHWEQYVSFLDDFNRAWGQHASSLVLVLSDRIMPGDGDQRPDLPSHYHSFDAGAAATHMALQAAALDYNAHAMAGILFDDIKDQLGVPERFKIEIAVAIGRRGEKEALPDFLQEMEAPSPRKPLSEIAFSGSFPAHAIPESEAA